MLREISWDDFQTWLAYAEMEPFDRDAYQLAHLTQVLWNIHRDTKKYPEGLLLSDFYLDFEGREREKPKQSVEYMEQVISDWVFIHNLLWKRDHPEDFAQ